MWFEIPKEVYHKIWHRYDKDLCVFGACTHLENSSLFDAKVLTEWGFKWAKNPIVKEVRQPESQVHIPPIAEWPFKFYVFVDDEEEKE